MTYQTFTEYNQTDLAGLLTYPASVVPQFIPLVLMAVFLITMMGSFFSQKRLTGRGDFLVSFSIAGFFTAVISFLMTLVEGLINLQTIVIISAIALIGIILLMINNNRS